MLSIISLLVILIISLIITRIATVALTLTGLSRESARFQARSAFTGVGFTTSESERVVSHPVRRRILMLLMLFGNAGIVTAVASIILAFVNNNSSANWFLRFGLLVSGLAGFWFIATSQWIDRRLSPVIAWALKRWARLDVRDYADVLHLAGEYGIKELKVNEQDWLSGKTLAELDLPHEGVLVLGIQRANGTYLGAPTGTNRILPDDTLILYGRSPVLADLDARPDDLRGARAHHHSVVEHRRVVEQEQQEDLATTPDAR